ncbi:MAG: hypothetical protein C0485_02025 [Pirellula sp.]|nr:hypothetical protein [Pirellula sp.]
MVIVLSLAILSAPSNKPSGVEGAIEIAASEDLDIALDEGLIDSPEIPLPMESTGPSLGNFEIGDEISLPGARSDTIGSPTGDAPTPQIGIPFSETASIAGNAGEAGVVGVVGSPFESLTNPLASRGGGLEGRTLENRRAAALSGGGTLRSEAAVEAALKWFSEHQWSDGGWRFDLGACPRCNGACKDSGSNNSSTAATGLALLCYLGAGYTHEQGDYKEQVHRGLLFLQEKMIVSSHGGDLRDHDTMYAQGIATLALTEAYAMTHDRDLRESVGHAIQFILDAQYEDGGWRYSPNWESPARGDTTVTGWQVAALRSASLTDIELPSELWAKIGRYLDSVQYDDGQNYLYVQGDNPNRRTAATPIGLLCRMIGGWKKDYRPLRQSVVRLGRATPSAKDVYFNYYASQVLHHVGGQSWQRWNPQMREYLIATQAKDGHERGSWYFSEPHSSTGGRLYTTAMATMTLEVYYRYMPLYKEAFVDRTPNGAVVEEPDANRERRD